jgi:predicted nucleic-acid-binding protein
MRAVDTNVLVRIVVCDEPKQLAAATRFVQGGAWIPLIVLVETVWVLSSFYELSRREIAETIDVLLNHQSLSVQDSEVVTAALGAFRNTGGVEFSDCLTLEVARRNGNLPVGTFDRRFGKLAGAALL